MLDPQALASGASTGAAPIADVEALRKALEAGYGTDMASLTGGAALRTQSLDRKIQSYWDFRDQFANDLRRQRVRINPQDLSPIHSHITRHYGLAADEAADYLERFLKDLDRHRNRRPL